MDDLKLISPLAQAGADFSLPSDKQDLYTEFVFCPQRPGNDLLWCMIPAHGVYDHFHTNSSPFLISSSI